MTKTPSSAYRPSAVETPIVRVRFMTPQDGVQQATWHSSWRGNDALAAALRGEQTPEARQWARSLTTITSRHLDSIDCTLLGIELIANHTLELECSGFGELA